MRPIAVILTALALLFSLTACAPREAEALVPSEEPPELSETPEEEPEEAFPVEETSEESPSAGEEVPADPLGGEAWIEITTLLPYSFDWDGDGDPETVDVRPEPSGSTQDDTTYPLVLTNGGETWESEDPGIWSYQLYLTDLGGDGSYELFLSGDTASNDYLAFCWRLTGGDPQPISFVGETRYEDEDLDGSVIGRFAGLDEEGRVLLDSTIQMLGTYTARRPYILSGEPELEPDPDTVWDYIDNDREITARIDLTAEGCLDGARNGAPSGETVSVPVDTKLVLTGSDGVSRVYFETADGLRGSLPVEKQDFLWYVQGLDENEVFGDLPYSD